MYKIAGEIIHGGLTDMSGQGNFDPTGGLPGTPWEGYVHPHHTPPTPSSRYGTAEGLPDSQQPIRQGVITRPPRRQTAQEVASLQSDPPKQNAIGNDFDSALEMGRDQADGEGVRTLADISAEHWKVEYGGTQSVDASPQSPVVEFPGRRRAHKHDGLDKPVVPSRPVGRKTAKTIARLATGHTTAGSNKVSTWGTKLGRHWSIISDIYAESYVAKPPAAKRAKENAGIGARMAVGVHNATAPIAKEVAYMVLRPLARVQAYASPPMAVGTGVALVIPAESINHQAAGFVFGMSVVSSLATYIRARRAGSN